jgi:hypothetical protein
MDYQNIIKSYSWKHLVNNCYEDYLEELDSDWQPTNIEVLSKSEWLKTEDAESFVMQVYKRSSI